MEYEAAKLAIAAEHDKMSDRLQAVSGSEKGAFGLTPDHIKATSAWQDAYKAERAAFNTMRKMNAFMTKNFKKEMRNDPDFNFRLRVL